MSRKSDERKQRKQERMRRDKEKKGSFTGSFAVGKNGFEFDFWNPEEGWNEIHIFPYLIKDEKHPEVVSGNMEVGDEDYFLEFGQHFGVGPEGRSSVLCLEVTYGKPCPICEHARELKKKGQQFDLPFASRRVLYNVMVEGEEGIKIFNPPERLFHRELKGKLTRSELGFFDYSDLEEGRMIRFWAEYDGKSKFKHLSYKDFEFIERDPLPESLLNKTIPLEMLLNVPTFEQVDGFYAGEIVTIDYRQEEEPRTQRESRKSERKEQRSTERVEDDDDFEEEPRKVGSRKVDSPPRKSESPRPRKVEDPPDETDLEYGDPCPYGLTFGKDHNTSKKMCGVKCPEHLFDACGDAKENEDDVPFEDDGSD